MAASQWQRRRRPVHSAGGDSALQCYYQYCNSRHNPIFGGIVQFKYHCNWFRMCHLQFPYLPAGDVRMHVDEHTSMMTCVAERVVEFSFCYRKYVNKHHFQTVSDVNNFVSETIDVQVCKERVFRVLISYCVEPFSRLNFIVIAGWGWWKETVSEHRQLAVKTVPIFVSLGDSVVFRCGHMDGGW